MIKRSDSFFKKWKEIDLETNYNIEKILGKGIFGTVVLAKQLTTDKMRAIKLIPVTDKSEKSLLTKELAAWKRVSSHCNERIVCLCEYGVTMYKGISHFALVMEYIPDSLELAQYAEEMDFDLSTSQIEYLLRNLVQGLRYIHKQGVFHRDIKPDNILISPAKKGGIKYIDFGLSCVKETEECQIISGTSNYIPIDIIKRATYLETDRITSDELRSADIYALGVTMYMILGQHPYIDAFVGDAIKDKEKFWGNILRIWTPLKLRYPDEEIVDMISSLVQNGVDARIKAFNKIRFT